MTTSKLPWGKFYWAHWASDPGLRLCSMAAQGFWMRMLCICAESDPAGYLVINGNPLDIVDLARVTGVPVAEAQQWVDELERNGVFSRTRKGTIYSRRMVADDKNRKKNAKNGKLGGSPKLSKIRGNSEWDNPQDKPGVKAKSIEDRVESNNNTPSFAPAPAETEKSKPPLALVPDTPAQAVLTEVMLRCRMIRPPAEVGLIVEWLKAGADPERHIYPVVDEMFAKARDGVSSLKFFNLAVLNRLAGDRQRIDADIARWERDDKRIAEIEAETAAANQREREREQRRAEARERHAAEQRAKAT